MTAITPSITCDQVILHLDMDAFFTSVEQADNPELRGKPVVIGQSLRGVVSAASYEARIFGVKSAMPVVQARKLCPQAIFLPGRMDRYRQVSARIMTVIAETCPVVEQASVDEAYADISGSERALGAPSVLGQRLKNQILEHTGLTCSVGIAPNKFLAKIASDWKKPDGLTIITAEHVASFLHVLPLAKIPGVGTRFLQELREMGVNSIPDILARPRSYWLETLGKRGLFLHDRAMGIDRSPVCPHSEPQSCSAENTLDHDTLDRDLLRRRLLAQAERVGQELRMLGKQGMTVTLKLKFNDFSTITRSTSLSRPTNLTGDIHKATLALLAREAFPRPVRLIGTGVSNFRQVRSQLPLAVDQGRLRRQALDQTMDRIRRKFGNASITRADVQAEGDGIGDLLSRKNRTSDQD